MADYYLVVKTEGGGRELFVKADTTAAIRKQANIWLEHGSRVSVWKRRPGGVTSRAPLSRFVVSVSRPARPWD